MGMGSKLGDGTKNDKVVPVKIMSETQFIGISAGNRHGFALGVNGKIYGFGNNYYGQLGDGTTTDRLIPVQIN